MMGVGASEFVTMWFLLLGGMGLPLGLPPEAEDPLLARIAPAECLVYGTWAGMAQPSPLSTNETERLLAEPDVQRAIRGLEKMIRKAVEREGGEGPGPEGALALEWGLKIATRPGAAFVTHFDPTQKKIEAGVILRLGEEDAAGLKRLLVVMQQQGPLTVTEKKIGGETFFVVKSKEGGDQPTITWGVRKNYVLFGIGDNALEGMLARASQNTVPAWLTAARKKAAVERLSTLTYVNVKAILELAGPQVAQAFPPEAAKAAGLGKLTDIVSVTGLDKTGFISRTLVGVEGELEGLLAALVDEPLTAADLGPIPADASVAFAGRLNLEKLYKKAVQIAGEVEPRAAEEIERELRRTEAGSGVDVRGKLLPGIGDVWRVWVSPSEGGFLSPTLVVNVRDRDRVQNALAAMEKLLPPDAGFDGPGGPAKVVREKLGNSEISTMRMRGAPFAPSWCVTEKELIVSSFPQNIRGYLRRGASYKSLATVAEASTAIEEGATLVTYADTKQLLEIAYPFLQLGLTAAANSGDGDLPFDLDPGLLPPLSAIAPHLRPSVGVVRRAPGGIEFTTRQTLPGSGLTTISPVGLALLLPAAQAARGAAQRTSSMNNMKQILLAFHNHADSHRNFPGAFTMTADEKPLLSWRVRLLPYIEEQNLFQQFKLDEPWDSEHNKPLLERMPAVYRDPRSTAPPGHTTYLGVRGKSETFEKGDLIENGQIKKAGGLTFDAIRDGTSNTIGVVEVTDEFAVPWTKPDDFDVAMANFQKVLFGNRPGFVAGFLDGHVQHIPAGTSEKTLKALFTRNGGEVIDLNALDARGAAEAVPETAPEFEVPERVPEQKVPERVPELKVPAPARKVPAPALPGR